MKRLMWFMIMILVAGLAVSCAGLKGRKAKECDKAAKGEKKVEAKAEKAEKKGAAREEKAKGEVQAKAEKVEEAKAEKVEAKVQAAGGLQKVESSLIDQVGYDPATQDLTIVFAKTGETYVYHKVPEKVYQKLMAADSKGKFFTKNIKNKYEFTKKELK